MARRSLSDPSVQQIIDRLVALYLRTGSVNAMAETLARAGGNDAPDGRIHPNRLHTLLSADPSRGINDSTLSALESSLARLDGLESAGDGAAAGEARRAAILERAAASGSACRDEAQAIADELGIPPAVVLSVTGWAESTHAAERAPGPYGPAPEQREPDWSYQDMAYKRCRLALHRTPGRKVGLIVPTGGGKTRIALRVVLGELHDSADRDSVVVWVTHRKRLATQAHRELQEMVTSGTPEVPDDAVALLARRVRFVLTTDLQRVMDEVQKVHMVVIDEAHHAAAPSYRPVFETRPAVPGLFLTATPRRRDERHIGIDEVAFSITYRQLFERGVLIEPTFETQVVPPNAWTDAAALDDFAEYLLDRAEQEFVKALVVTTTVERVRALHAALERMLLDHSDHILGLEDIGWVHGSGSSTGATPEDFLDDFLGQARGILVATSSLLGEGFDDPGINAVVVTFPSTSLVQLMQVAGRCLRFARGKRRAFVVQVKDSPLAYHFEQRWLYREISDVLHPQLVDIEYSSKDNLRQKVEGLLRERNVRDEVRTAALARLEGIVEGETCAFLLTGLPYSGPVEAFAQDARWSAVLETPENSDLFREIFNEFCERETQPKDLPTFLKAYLSVNVSPGSEWQGYMNMIQAAEYARREIQEQEYEGRSSRPYAPNKGTTWLTYVTFTYSPTVPAELREFLRPCVNADRVLAEYATDPGRWTLVVRLLLPLAGAFAWLLDAAQSAMFAACRQELTERVRGAAPADGFSVVAAWLAGLPSAPLPLPVLTRLERFLTDEGHARDTLVLNTPDAEPKPKPPSLAHEGARMPRLDTNRVLAKERRDRL